MNVAILGTGNFGTAFATLLARQGHQVAMWGVIPEVVTEINHKHTNHIFLPEVDLLREIRATLSLAEALQEAKIVFLAVPSSVMREVIRKAVPLLKQGMILVNLAKGLEFESMKRMSEVIAGELSQLSLPIVALSGPSFGKEIAAGIPTSVAVASLDPEAAATVKQVLASDSFYVQIVDDVTGLELAGAFKNPLAVMLGIADGLGLGSNTKAALLTHGFNEICQLALAMGAKQETLLGIAGLGDVLLTCTSSTSRNFRAGQLLGSGHNLEETLAKVGMVVEGIDAAKVLYLLSAKYNLQLPVIAGLYTVLYQDAEINIDLVVGCLY